MRRITSILLFFFISELITGLAHDSGMQAAAVVQLQDQVGTIKNPYYATHTVLRCVQEHGGREDVQWLLLRAPGQPAKAQEAALTAVQEQKDPGTSAGGGGKEGGEAGGTMEMEAKKGDEGEGGGREGAEKMEVDVAPKAEGVEGKEGGKAEGEEGKAQAGPSGVAKGEAPKQGVPPLAPGCALAVFPTHAAGAGLPVMHMSASPYSLQVCCARLYAEQRAYWVHCMVMAGMPCPIQWK